MKRYVSGLNQASTSASDGVIDGLFLVRIERFQYRWHRQKPFYAIKFSVVEPISIAGDRLAARLSCSSKNLWKLNWFLRDFGYDPELLERNEIDDKSLVSLCGVVKISQSVINGTTVLDLDGFAPASSWERLPGGTKTPVSLEMEESTTESANSKAHPDLQLQPTRPLPELPAQVSASLSGWLAGEGLAGLHALWSCL
jgi:hypothetical protein